MKRTPVFTVTAHYVIYVFAGIALAIWAYAEMNMFWFSMLFLGAWLGGLAAFEFSVSDVESHPLNPEHISWEDDDDQL